LDMKELSTTSQNFQGSGSHSRHIPILEFSLK
jgi:hypothetical protein